MIKCTQILSLCASFNTATVGPWCWQTPPHMDLC